MSEAIVIGKARENIQVAAICVKGHDFPNVCVSRSYYACAQIATACLIRWGCLPSKPDHFKIIRKFEDEWRKRHEASPHVAILNALFNERFKADYHEDYRFGTKQAIFHLIQAQHFINYITQRERL